MHSGSLPISGSMFGTALQFDGYDVLKDEPMDDQGRLIETPPSASSLQQVPADYDLNFGDMRWPSIQDFFPQYTEPQLQAQQPTPAWSDIEDDMKITAGTDAQTAAGALNIVQNNALLTPGAQGDAMLCDSNADHLPSQFLDHTFDDAFGNNNTEHDFQLFGELSQTAASDMAPMFTDLGSVGGQFSPAGQDPMYEAMDQYLKDDFPSRP